MKFAFEFWKMCYLNKWVADDELINAVTLNILTEEEKDSILACKK